MTPEEKFKRLRDESLWQDVRIPRGRTLAPVHRSRIWQWVVPVVSGLVVAALVVVGVNTFRDSTPPVQPALPTDTATPAPTPTATPTQTAPPVITPETATCTDFLDPDVIAGFEADGYTERGDAFTQEVLDAGGILSEFVKTGGLACQWQNGDRTTDDFQCIAFAYDAMTDAEAAENRSVNTIGGSEPIRSTDLYDIYSVGGGDGRGFAFGDGWGVYEISQSCSPDRLDMIAEHAAAITPTSAVETNAAPSQLFDGDCENVLPDATVDEIAGTDMSNDPELVGEVMGEYPGQPMSPVGFAMRQLGGINCSWFSNKTSQLINFTLLPAGQLPTESTNELCGKDQSGWSGCVVDVETEGIRISGSVGQTGGSKDTGIASDLVDLVATAAAGQGDVTGHAQGDGDWPFPAACADIDAASGIAGDIQTPGTDSGGSSVFGDVIDLRCDWASGIVEYRPGGAWAESMVADLEGATDIDVQGFDRVIRVDGINDQPVYHFFRGSNWLFIDQKPTKQSDVIDFATQVADGLDKL
jgi:hypothetical protein